MGTVEKLPGRANSNDASLTNEERDSLDSRTGMTPDWICIPFLPLVFSCPKESKKRHKLTTEEILSSCSKNLFDRYSAELCLTPRV